VGPKAVLDECEKYRLQARFDPRTVQHVASRYTDYAIPAPLKDSICNDTLCATKDFVSHMS
jgi:hypothetical protein